eukprot:451091_1
MSFFQVRNTFKHTHIIKNFNFNNIQKRHNTSPFPFRPGYGLGSMIPPGLINGMKKEAKIRTKIIAFQQMYNDLESTERELTLEMNAIQNNQSISQSIPRSIPKLAAGIFSLQKMKEQVMTQRLLSYAELIALQTTLMHAADIVGLINMSDKSTAVENMSFSTFDSSIESPVEWSVSKIDYVDRATDSMQINAHFFDKNKMKEGGLSYSASVAQAAEESLKGTVEGVAVTTGNGIKAAVHNSTTATTQHHDVESTLLLTAMATHRYVKQFNPLSINIKKLANAWNYFHPTDKVSLTTPISNPLESINPIGNDISMISEEFLGSCMVGMVHFIKTDSTSSLQSATSASFQETATIEVTAAASLAALTGETSIATQVAKKFALSSSSTGIDVKFDMVCQGYMPKLKSNIVQDSIKEFKNFSPESLNVARDDGLLTSLPSTQKLAEMNKSHGTAQSNSGAMIKATIMGLEEADANSYKVLDYNTFMNAFDDYAKNAGQIKGAGIPIGMNIKTWTKKQVLNAMMKQAYDDLDKMEDKMNERQKKMDQENETQQ